MTDRGTNPNSRDCFSKNIKNFVWFPKQYLVGFFILEKFRTGVSCFSVTLFYFTLLALTDGQNHRRRVKYTRCAWAGGTFSPVVLLCQFFVLAGNRFWFTYLCTKSSCGVVSVFLVLAGNSFWCVRSPYSCGVVLVFWFWQEIGFGFIYYVLMYLEYNTVVVLC